MRDLSALGLGLYGSGGPGRAGPGFGSALAAVANGMHGHARPGPAAVRPPNMKMKWAIFCTARGHGVAWRGVAQNISERGSARAASRAEVLLLTDRLGQTSPRVTNK